VRTRSLGCLVLLILLSGCATPQATEEEQQTYDEAISVLQGDPQEAANRLETFLRVYPLSPLAEQAAWERSQLALAAADRGRAGFWLGWLVRNHPRGPYADETRIELARLHARTGDFEMARRLLRDVRTRRLSSQRRRELYRLNADVSQDGAERVRWLASARSIAAESVVSDKVLELMDAELAAAVDGLSLSELEAARSFLGGRTPAGRVALRLVEESLDEDEFEDAADDLLEASDFDLTVSDRDLLGALLLRVEQHEMQRGKRELLPTFADVAARVLPSRSPARGSLGVVLPLSGPYASYGEDSLRGVLLAARVFGEAGGSDVRVVVRDSGGDPLRAAAAVRELAKLEGLSAIVGPLRSSASESAARVAQEEEVPLIALTSRERVSQERPYVFRLRTTAEDETRYLVDYAFHTLGARRFAVLYPDDGYGRGMRDHFWQMVDESGGWLMAAAAYPPDSTDFGASIREMIGYALLTPSESIALVERERFLRRGRRLPPEDAALTREIADGMIGPEGEVLPPIVDFDVLFIPDGYEQVGLLAPQLAFHELTGVQLLGVSDWHHPELIEIAQEHVSGAVISALYDANSRFAFEAGFVDAYRSTFGLEPDAFSAHAYDAANLVLVQLAKGLESREAIRDGLLSIDAYPGASGVTSMRPDGNASKRPFLLQVRGSAIVPLD